MDPEEQMKIKIRRIPGLKSQTYLKRIKKLNLGWATPYPYIHSGKGQGCYFQDIDKNIFLDFACQIASNPLGYNHSSLNKIIKKYKKHPIKYAGQDFIVKEHVEMLEELLSIVPKTLNSAFLVNSGAEAVENSIKICMRKRPATKLGISFEHAFHGRTLGALSLTNSKKVQKKNYLQLPTRRLPFTEEAGIKLQRILEEECPSENFGFVIVEPVQGEGGYHPAPQKLMKDIREITKQHKIPLICDEVQAGMGRTGKWWSHQHYNIKPDVISSAKALQVGACISSKEFQPEPGAISSTWGGGHTLDLALGIETIRIIKKHNLLENIKKQGAYLKKILTELEEKRLIQDVRGLGLMLAFDLKTTQVRDNLTLECIKNGLILLGCGQKGIRVIPPYIITKKEIDQAIEVLEPSLKKCNKKNFKHKGPICKFADCGKEVS